jgi:hypothetical protein
MARKSSSLCTAYKIVWRPTYARCLPSPSHPESIARYPPLARSATHARWYSDSPSRLDLRIPRPRTPLQGRPPDLVKENVSFQCRSPRLSLASVRTARHEIRRPFAEPSESLLLVLTISASFAMSASSPPSLAPPAPSPSSPRPSRIPPPPTDTLLGTTGRFPGVSPPRRTPPGSSKLYAVKLSDFRRLRLHVAVSSCYCATIAELRADAAATGK